MTTRAELLMAVNQLPGVELYTVEEMVTFLGGKIPDIKDPILLHRAVDFAIEVGVIDRSGKLYMRRHSATPAQGKDFETATADYETSDEVDTTRLAYLIRTLPQLDGRLASLEHEVAELRTSGSNNLAPAGAGQWLQLFPTNMPRPIYDALRTRAIAVHGAAATDQVITTQMVLLAAQLLQQAINPVMGRTK